MGGDNHLFVMVLDGDDKLTDWFLTEEHKPFRVMKSSGVCICGCGGMVRGTNKYADGLKCYRRHIAKGMAEIEDGDG